MLLRARAAGLIALFAIALDTSAGSVWVRGADQLHEIDASANRVARTLVIDRGGAIAADAGGVWILAGDMLHRFEAGTSPAWSIDLKGHAKQPGFLAADPRGRHLWVVAKDEVLRVSLPERALARLAFDGTNVQAVDAGLDGSLWVLANKTLWHYPGDGSAASALDLHPLTTSQPKFVAVDSLDGAVWIAGEKRVIRFDPAAPSTSLVSVVVPESAEALAVDRRSGVAWIAGKDSLQVVRPDVSIARSVDLAAAGVRDVAGLAPDVAGSSLWAIHRAGASRMTADGLLVATVPLDRAPDAIAAAALRIEPTVSITGPADEALLNVATPAISLRFGATCSGTPCGFGAGAFSGYRLSTVLDGAPASIPFTYDPVTGLATGTPATPLAEGLHVLEAVVVDAFGSQSVPALARFTVDTTAPRFVSLNPADGSSTPAASITIAGSVDEPATVTLSGEGNSATATGTTFSFPVSLRPGLNTLALEATDAAGNRRSATLRITLASSVKIVIESPAAGAALTGSDVLVTGSVEGPANTGVVVNGVVASNQGSRFFAAVPLHEGYLPIEAVATTPEGATASASVAITVGGAPDYEVVPTTRIGFAPTGMAFAFTNRTGSTITRVDADFEGDGRIDRTSTSPAPTFSTAYYSPGTFTPRFTLRDSSGRTYTLTTQIVIRDRAILDQELRSLWSAFVATLAAGDVDGALSYFTLQGRQRYAEALEELRGELPGIAASFSQPQTFLLSNDIGEYAVNRTLDGRDMIFLIYFLRDVDGIWRLDSM
jgi:hypothetical protein